MLKRILSFILCISILLCSIFICVYTPVYASDVYNTIYDNFDYSSVISEHKSFTFTDKGGGKHPVVRVGSAWLTGLGSGQIISNDSDLNYYLSWYSYKGYNQKSDTGKGILSLINSKLGAVVSLSSDLLSSVLLSVPDVDIDYNDNDGLAIASDSVDKLREEIKKQYNTLIGLDSYPCTQNTSVKDYVSSSNFRNMFEHEEDYTDSYSRFIDYDYCITDYYNDFAFFFNGTDIDDFFYVSNSSSDRHLFGGDRVWNEYKIYKYNNNNVTPLNMSF